MFFCIARRRLDKQPIISCAPSAATVIPQSVQQALLATLHQVETLRGVRLYPLLLDVLPDDAFQQHASAEQQGKQLVMGGVAEKSRLFPRHPLSFV